MKASILFCFTAFLVKSDEYQTGVFNNDYEPSMFNHHDSRFPPSPYDSFKKELVVDQVIEESPDFKIKARNVKKWLRLSLDNLYLLGISDKEVSLVSMYKLQSNIYQAHEYPLEMQYEVSCGVMFKSRRPNDDSFEGVVLIALKSPRPIVSVYKIKHFKLHHIIDWRRDHNIHAISYFKWHHEDRFIIFENRKNVSTATVYGFEFDDHAPHYWLVEMISLGSTRGQPALGHVGGDTLFLATIQVYAKAVNVYSYKKVCPGVSGNKFELVLTITDLNAEKIEFFQAYGHLYFIVSGSPSVLYRITADGYLMKDIIFGSSVEMIAIPIKSARHDTILLGKSMDGTPHVYTYIGSGMWEEKMVPMCRRSSHDRNEIVELKECIGGNRSWEGATHVEMEGDLYPSILFANRNNSGELYYLPFSFIKIRGTQQSVNPFMLDRLETYWNNLKTSLGKLLRARAHEGSSPSSSYCIIEKELNDMHSHLSEIRMPLDWTDCSASVFQMDETLKEDEHVIADEGKPIETITIPDISSSNQDDSQKNDILPISPFPFTQPSHPIEEKPIPISPDLNNDAWDNTDIINEQHDGYDIYNSGRR